MTSNSNFADYVERVQENLAVLSLPDDKARLYLMESQDLASYNPRSIAFEILLNEKVLNEKREEDLNRKFDPHISDELFEQVSFATCLADLKRLYQYAAGKKVDLSTTDWSVPSHVENDPYLSEKIKRSLERLQADMGELGTLHECLKSLDPEEIAQQEAQSSLDPDIERDLRRVKEILSHILNRYEVECFDTNIGTTALVYEAWKQGKLVPLGNPETDADKFDRLISGLFISVGEKNYPTLLENMAENLGLDNPPVRTIEQDQLSNGKTWQGGIEGKPWFYCVENALIHRLDSPLVSGNAHRYLIYYPLIIDDYWFAGAALLYSDLNVDPGIEDIPEIFQRKKYPKIYNTIKSVSDTLKISLREEALKQAETKLRAGISREQVFYDVVRDYFVCFNVRRTDVEGEKNTSLVLTDVVYEGCGIKIFGPQWLAAAAMSRKQGLIKGEIEGYNAGVSRIPGLYGMVMKLAQELADVQKQSQQEVSGRFVHQSATLIKEVWDEKHRLSEQTQYCMWHLRYLLDVWSTTPLQPEKDILDELSPNIIGEQTRDILEYLTKVALSQALRKATSPRDEDSDEEQRTRDRANKLDVNVVKLKQDLGLPDFPEDIPNWIRLRGFAFCYHHALWQAAYHALYAKSNGLDPVEPNSSIFLRIEVSDQSIKIMNAGNPSPPTERPINDSIFFEDLTKRLEEKFSIIGPTYDESEKYWITQIFYHGK